MMYCRISIQTDLRAIQPKDGSGYEKIMNAFNKARLIRGDFTLESNVEL